MVEISVCDAIENNYSYKKIKKIIENGADVNLKDSWGYSPLMCACNNDLLDVIELLLLHGADVNATSTRGGATALMIACHMLYDDIPSNIELVKTIVNHSKSNIDVYLKHNQSGYDVIEWCNNTNNTNVVEYLREKNIIK